MDKLLRVFFVPNWTQMFGDEAFRAVIKFEVRDCVLGLEILAKQKEIPFGFETLLYYLSPKYEKIDFSEMWNENYKARTGTAVKEIMQKLLQNYAAQPATNRWDALRANVVMADFSSFMDFNLIFTDFCEVVGFNIKNLAA